MPEQNLKYLPIMCIEKLHFLHMYSEPKTKVEENHISKSLEYEEEINE